ncbi:MAG: hypothetical protein Q9183_000261 [Haloplaca sp. 2 TL-2023]
MPTDPCVAKEHALAAAHHAFGRAAESELSSRTSSDMVSLDTATYRERPITQSQSIRFAGPSAVPHRNLDITRRAPPASHHDHRPSRQSLQPGLRRHQSFLHEDDGSLTALPSNGEYVESRVASQPSSYRKLRKSKSMLTPQGSSLSAILQSAGSARAESGWAKQQSAQSGSRLGRSFSFIRPNAKNKISGTVSSEATQNEAVGLARDQYLRQLEQQRAGQPPSVGDQAARRRVQKTFRKSVRTSSANSLGTSGRSPSSQAEHRIDARGIGGKARDFSSSFRNKLKRVFARSSGQGGTFPAQQLHATRPHFGNAPRPYVQPDSPGQLVESLYDVTPERSSSRQPSVLHVLRHRVSLADSLKSANSDRVTDNGNSRVTSWADSTNANTVNLRQTSGPQRLSIIREIGSGPSHLESSRGTVSSQGVVPAGPDLESSARDQIPKTPRCIASSSDTRQGLDFAQTASVTAKEIKDEIPGPQIPKGRPVDAPQGDITIPSPKRPLRESKSMFFPHSTHIERSGTSPFRQAMQSSAQSVETQCKGPLRKAPSMADMASYLSAPSLSRDRTVTRSPSVYSRSSSGDNPQEINSSMTIGGVDRREKNDAAIVVPAMALDDTQRCPMKQRYLSNDFAASANRSNQPRHKREHAQVRGDDTDIGRLHTPVEEPTSFSAGGPISLDNRMRLRHHSSQPMIDRFPLMVTRPQAYQPHATPRPFVKSENRHPSGRTSNYTASLSVKRPEASNALVARHPTVFDQDHEESHQNTNGRLKTSPASHSRSSPERLARLRRMQSSRTLGSLHLRKDTESTPGLRERMLNCQDREGGNTVDRSPDSRKMVDTFLSYQRKSRSRDENDTVFI